MKWPVVIGVAAGSLAVALVLGWIGVRQEREFRRLIAVGDGAVAGGRTSDAIEMFSGPGETFQVLTQVHEGTKFEIVETRGDWVSVKLANGKGGFVRLSDLGKV